MRSPKEAMPTTQSVHMKQMTHRMMWSLRQIIGTGAQPSMAIYRNLWQSMAIYGNPWQSMAIHGNLVAKPQLVISSLSSIAMRACTSKASTCLGAVAYSSTPPCAYTCLHLLTSCICLHLLASACICLITLSTRSICQVTDWSCHVPEGPLDQLSVDHL